MSAATGDVVIVLEPSGQGQQGVVPLLSNTPLATSVTGFSQPPTSPATGEHVEINVLASTVVGTVTISGLSPSGGSISETTPNIPPANPNSQSIEVSKFQHITQKIFATIASVAATSGLVGGGGLIRLGGIQGEKFRLPSISFKGPDKRPEYSANMYNNSYSRHTNRQQLNIEVDWEMKHPLFPDTCLYNPYMHFGNPSSVVSLPSTPDVLLAATSVAGSMSLTTQPKLPGEKMIATVAGASAAGTITFVGVNRYGQNVTDVISASGNGVFYSGNVYKSVSSIATTGLTGGTLAVGGVFGWMMKWDDLSNADTWYSAMIGFFNGTDTKLYPFSYIEETNIEFGQAKEFTITSKGKAQDALPVGDRTVTPMATTRLSTLAQPVDQPIVGWETNFWLDAQYATPQTTLYPNVVTECKINIKTPRENVPTIQNTQRFSSVWNKKEGREFMFEMKGIYFDVLQYEKWRRNEKQTLSVGTFGQQLGNVGGNVYQEGWFWTMPFKYDADGVASESDPGKGPVDVTFKGTCELAPELGYNIQLTCLTANPPTYLS